MLKSVWKMLLCMFWSPVKTDCTVFGCCRVSKGLLDQVDLRASRAVLEPEDRR